MQSIHQSILKSDWQVVPGDFWRWWRAELAGAADECVAWIAPQTNGQLIVDIDSTSLTVSHYSNEELIEEFQVELSGQDENSIRTALDQLGRTHPHTNGEIILRLGGSRYLTRAIQLPQATVENLRQVLQFEMDRYTPFHSSDVYFNYRQTSRDARRGMVNIEMYVTPKREVNTLVSLFENAGNKVVGVLVGGEHLDPLQALSLLGDDKAVKLRGVMPDATGRFYRRLGVLTAVLLLTAISIPIVQMRAGVIDLQPEVVAARQEAAQTHSLRREFELRTAEHDFLFNKKLDSMPVIVLLDQLARLLPDDTWVERLDLKEGRLNIQGETDSSSKLIVLVESAGYLKQARYTAPLTKGRSGKERFSLEAQVIALSSDEITSELASRATVEDL